MTKNNPSGSDRIRLRDEDLSTDPGPVGTRFVVCDALGEAGFVNAFSTRKGGVSNLPRQSLNLGRVTGDSNQNVEENRRRFRMAIGANQFRILTARQTHSTKRVVVDSPDFAPECDALMTKMSGILLGIQTADCLPILIGDPKTGAMAAIHAGWRGTAGRITERTIADLVRSFGLDPRTCIAALGPAACADCYEVGQDVIDTYKNEFAYWRKVLKLKSTGKANLDIKAANLQQLEFCGFDRDRIHVAYNCTMHQNDLFFSYRKEGRETGAGVGRLLSVIGRQAGPA